MPGGADNLSEGFLGCEGATADSGVKVFVLLLFWKMLSTMSRMSTNLVFSGELLFLAGAVLHFGPEEASSACKTLSPIADGGEFILTDGFLNFLVGAAVGSEVESLSEIESNFLDNFGLPASFDESRRIISVVVGLNSEALAICKLFAESVEFTEVCVVDEDEVILTDGFLNLSTGAARRLEMESVSQGALLALDGCCFSASFTVLELIALANVDFVCEVSLINFCRWSLFNSSRSAPSRNSLDGGGTFISSFRIDDCCVIVCMYVCMYMNLELICMKD